MLGHPETVSVEDFTAFGFRDPGKRVDSFSVF